MWTGINGIIKNGFFSKLVFRIFARVFAYISWWDTRTNVKQEPEWRKSFLLHAYVHNSKLKNAAIRMVLGHIFTRVFLFLPIFTHVHLCLPLFTCVYLCLPMFTRVQKCLIFLPMFNNDYSCLPMFTNVYLGLITYVYTCLFVFSYVYS